MAEPEHPHGHVRDLAARYQLDAGQQAAVSRAYEAFRVHHGPFMVAIAAQMLPDLHADVRNGSRVVFLGRDGRSLAVATRVLDPELFAEHSHEVVLSRALGENALQDRERYLGAQFDQVEAFRRRDKATEIEGASRSLTGYLRGVGVPVGRAVDVTLIDTSFKGTVQEMLAAHYPATRFTGRYAFFAASPHDPHPGSKQGYAFHRDVDDIWQGIPIAGLPDDPALTFGCQEAVAVIEETLHGPLTSPTRLGPTGPQQTGQHLDDTLAGLNPAVVSPDYRDPRVREAIKAAADLAVHDSATAAVASRDAGRDWQTELQQAQQRFTHQTRAWISNNRDQLDPELGAVLDSFVRRPDHDLVDQLGTVLEASNLPREQITQTWHQFAQLDSVEAKQTFLTQTQQQNAAPPAARRAATAASAALAPSRKAPQSSDAPASTPPKRSPPQSPSQQQRRTPPRQGR